MCHVTVLPLPRLFTLFFFFFFFFFCCCCFLFVFFFFVFFVVVFCLDVKQVFIKSAYRDKILR